MNKVAATIIRREFKHELYMKTKKSMELAGLNEKITGNKVLLAPDFRTQRVIPGACTSPWVIESVIRVLRELKPELSLHICTRNPAALQRWGVKKICLDKKVEIIDLNKEKLEEYRGMKVPRIVLAANHIINIPVVGVGPFWISGAMANQARIVFEDVDDKKVVKANTHLPPAFVVVDATICGQIAHPYIVHPKIRDTIISGKNVTAVEKAICELASVKEPQFLKKAVIPEYKLIGSLKGESLKSGYLPANSFLRDIYSYLWYNFSGKKMAKKIVKHPLYGGEFKGLV